MILCFTFRLYTKKNILNDRTLSGSHILTDVLKYITERDDRFPDHRPKRRIFFILKVLKALIMKKENDSSTQEYIKCFRSFFRVIPDPLICRDEVKSFLVFLFKDASCNGKAIEEFLNIYTDLFDLENSMSYAPRTLKHLSRYAVRKCIIRNSTAIKNCLDDLHLPVTLNNLLLGASEYDV